VDGTVVGPNQNFVITDEEGNILAIPETGGPIDLNGAGVGICLVYHISYFNILRLEVGQNLEDLIGCFNLTYPITITRVAGEDCANICNAFGGTINLEDGSTSTNICVDGEADPLVVVRGGIPEGSNQTFVITDDQNNVLAIPTNNGPFNLDPAGPGTCLIWYLAHEDNLTGLAVGANIDSDLEGCFDFSNPITVVRDELPVGGSLALEGGSTVLDICAVDGIPDPFDVVLNGNSGPNSSWIITDAAGFILAQPSGPPFDLFGAGLGICFLYHLSSTDDIEGLTVGNEIGSLTGCFGLSNAIQVTRRAPTGGTIFLTGGLTETEVCVDGSTDSTRVFLGNDAIGEFRTFLVTDSVGTILAITGDDFVFDLDGAGPGVCFVYYLGYQDGLIGLELGQNIADLEGCFGFSNPITFNRTEPLAGMISLADGSVDTTICVDGEADPLTVVLDGSANGNNASFVITDDENNILAIPSGTGPFDLDGAGVGICRIYYVVFNTDSLLRFEVGENLDNTIGCFQLSNPVTVNRVSGGDCPDGLGNPEEAAAIESALCIFPNPVEENNISITVDGIDGEVPSLIQIIDQNGQQVLTFSTTVLEGAPTILQLPDLQAGSYFLRLTNGGTVITERFTSF